MRASQAESFKIAGPLIPRWVMSKGPVWDCLGDLSHTLALGTESPDRPKVRVSLMLKANKEGASD